MTTQEWLVVAAAGVVFIIANIIMWNIIAAKERRNRQETAEEKPEVSEKTMPLPPTEREPLETAQVSVPKRTKTFRITEDIVIVHTDERI